MSIFTRSVPFRANTIKALNDPSLRSALRHATETFAQKRSEAKASVPFEAWRDDASAMRSDVLSNLSGYLDLFRARAVRAGATVHLAKDAGSAREIIVSVLKQFSAKRIVKSKSMITEEIHLNSYLHQQGFNVVETDLGEYIIQLAQESPSHIIVPAVHKTRRQVGRLFAEKLGCDYTEDPFVLTKIVRRVLRDEFVSADAGISGANFAVADSGSIVIVTNEGNGRMVTTLPPLHIAVFSIEKIIPSLADLPKLLRTLTRSATGQTLSSYVSVITGSRKPGETTGATELHLVILDNGRSEIVNGEFREILKCVRCGACMNVCPVYRTVGGHAYASTYPGPMGIILTTLLERMERAHTLLDATTLCGACAEVCPVKVPLPRLLRRLRELRVEQDFTTQMERRGMDGFALAAQSPRIFHLGQKVARLSWPLLKKLDGNGALVRMPRPDPVTFTRRMQ
ncbi:MAG: LutB/LldF family L-lactate oxidation iron-sulfur protein [Thermodesulfobacteriota bacterium]